MTEWFKAHPGGPHTITKDGHPIHVDAASDRLKEALAGHEKWSKVRGFHTFRHTVASILASSGQDQRYIDQMLGHQTEEMRQRYQHLIPGKLTRAIDTLLAHESRSVGGLDGRLLG